MEERKWTRPADEGRGENCEETELFQKQPKPSPAGVLLRLQGFWGPLFACSLQKKRKKNLPSANIVGPDIILGLSSWQILYFQKNMELWSHDPNHEQNGSEFSKPRWGAQEHCRPALEGGWVSVPKWEKGACDQSEMITKRSLGLTFCHSLPGELAQCGSQDTAASPPGSSKEEDMVQGEWCVVPWAPPLSPALPLLLCPGPCLTTGNQPLDRRSSCTPLLLWSCFCSLRGRHM